MNLIMKIIDRYKKFYKNFIYIYEILKDLKK